MNLYLLINEAHDNYFVRAVDEATAISKYETFRDANPSLFPEPFPIIDASLVASDDPATEPWPNYID
jgi:hypothetical protein